MAQSNKSEDNTSKKENSAKGESVLPTVRWDDSKLVSNYANVCNVSSTREEVTLLFGTNQTWNTGQKELVIDLTNRIVMNPYAAKRLSLLLNNVVGQYESAFGELKVESAKR